MIELCERVKDAELFSVITRVRVPMSTAFVLGTINVAIQICTVYVTQWP